MRDNVTTINHFLNNSSNALLCMEVLTKSVRGYYHTVQKKSLDSNHCAIIQATPKLNINATETTNLPR